MNYRRNILAGISGIVISIGTLSTSASANPKSFIFEGQILASVKKLIKYRVKADQFADDAEASAKQANTNAAKLEVCCSELPEADEASEYANQAKEAAISARDKSDRASSTNKSSKAKDLKDKAKGFASQAEEAAEKVTTLLNDALESLKEEFTPRVSVALDLAESSAKRASEAVSTAKDCCSEQKIDGDISDIEDAEEAAEEAAKAASEAVSSANLAKRHPDDFSDLYKNCTQGDLFVHKKHQNIGYPILNKKTKKVRYKGYQWQNVWYNICKQR